MATRLALALAGFAALLPAVVRAQTAPDRRFPLYAYLTGAPAARMVGYTPSRLDPRVEANQRTLRTSEIRADLEALRPTFDGLVLYGYNETCTPRIVAIARALKYRAVLLAVWDIKSRAELLGAAELANDNKDAMAVGLIIGNEGITQGRYEKEDLTLALATVRPHLAPAIPVATSEPLGGYDLEVVRTFGDFLAPNIHPVFDRPGKGPEDAAAWAREEAVKLMRATGKPVLLKETGFPHDGKPIYTPDSQRAFWAAFVKPGTLVRAGANWASFGVAFEAFDLPWKAEASGLPIEKAWGLFGQDRRPYPVAGVWAGVK